MSQPSSLISNHRQLESSQHSASLPPDLNISHQRKSAAVNQNMAPPQNFRPSNPNESYPNFEQANRSVHSDLNNVTAGLDRSETSALWEGPVGYPRAVPIRPPHQSDDPYMNEDVQSVVSGKPFRMQMPSCLDACIHVVYWLNDPHSTHSCWWCTVCMPRLQ